MVKKVLIADDDRDVVELLSRRCRSLGLHVDSAGNAMQALSKAEANTPDLMILDVDMPHGNGLSVCEMMSDHEQLRSIPVIMLTSCSSEDTIRRCHRLCAYYVLKCPDAWPRVEPLLRELLLSETSDNSGPSVDAESEATETPDGEMLDMVFAMLGAEQDDRLSDQHAVVVTEREDRAWVLSIEDDDDFALALSLRLRELGLHVVRATAGSEGYRKAFLNPPRAIILDYELPQGNGDYVLRRLKESPVTVDIPVIMLTGRHEAAIERQVRALGASEFLTKPLDWKRLRAALQHHLDGADASLVNASL